jgi:hypothetical protein
MALVTDIRGEWRAAVTPSTCAGGKDRAAGPQKAGLELYFQPFSEVHRYTDASAESGDKIYRLVTTDGGQGELGEH